jgi:hypothetical protein
MRCLRLRKQFVQSHPKKLEIAKKIIEARKDKKILTFSATIADAEKIGIGSVLHSKQSKNKNSQILENFKKAPNGVINSSKALVTGEPKIAKVFACFQHTYYLCIKNIKHAYLLFIYFKLSHR